MSVLSDFTAALAEGRVEVIDLTAPLSDQTPILQLPPPFANTQGFALQEISHYDERGPGWYWNNFSAGEHVGTHFDAPVHWISGRDGLDVSQVPAAAVDRAGGRHRQERRVRQQSGLPARGRARRGVAAAARPAAGGRLAAVPHRLGHPRPRPGRRS